MIQPLRIVTAAGEQSLADLAAPLPLDDLVPPRSSVETSQPETTSLGSPLPPGRLREGGDWEVEIGFGKGRYLLRRCQEDPDRRFLGIELASEYWGMFVDRARRHGVTNWVAIRGEALSILSAVLPHGFAAAVHVYFPDPWPKSRHHKRRLFDPETVDLVLSLLRPGGRLYFATDFLEYGALVQEILESYPGLRISRRDAVWDEGPRTNYEAKYIVEGRPILRLEGTLEAEARLHPQGAKKVLAAVGGGEGEQEPSEAAHPALTP